MTQIASENACRASILVVPDGVAPNGDMRLSLQITPVADPGSADPAAIDVNDWPSAIRQLATKVKLHVADILSPIQLSQPVPLPGDYRSDITWSADAARRSDALWHKTFGATTADLLSVRSQSSATRQLESLRNDSKIYIAPVVHTGYLGDEVTAAYRSRVARAVNRHTGSLAPRLSSLAAVPANLDRWLRPGMARDPVGKMMDKEALQQRRRRIRSVSRSLGASTAVAPADIPAATARINQAPSVAWLRARHRADELRGIAERSHQFATEHVESLLGDRFADALDEFELALTTVDDTSQPPALPQPTPQDTAKRKLSSILATPTIAKFLGIVIDITVPAADWAGATQAFRDKRYGAVAATLGDAALPDDAEWSAFVHGGRFAPADFFGPCDQQETFGEPMAANLEIVGGVLNLRKQSGGQPRFQLSIVDAVNSVLMTQDAAIRRAQSLRSGETVADTVPNPAGRSITLVDTLAAEAAGKRADRERRLAATPPHTPRINFAQDLLRGYTPMAAVARLGTTGYQEDSGRWRSLVARRITFEDGQIDPAFIATFGKTEREFGYAVGIKVEQLGGSHEEQPIQRIDHAQELLVWAGNSLAVADSSENRTASAMVDQDKDLAVELVYHLPDEPASGTVDYRPPPLRDGQAYLLGLAVSYVNGCGLRQSEATQAHASDRYGHVLGDSAGGPLVFTRPERLPPPLVLLPPESPVVTQKNVSALHGETAETLVVRTATHGSGTSHSVRYFFPHGVDFDRAEQQDQFRGVTEDVPPGAFADQVGVLWSDGGSAFPVAADGHIVTSATGQKGSRGSVLQLRGTPMSVERQYYVDANSQFVRAHIRGSVPADQAAVSMDPPLPFWPSGRTPKQALPVVLELTRAAADLHAPRVSISAETAWISAYGSQLKAKVAKIKVALQPATSVDLAAVAEAEPVKTIRQHLFGTVLLEHARGTLGADAPPAAAEQAAARILGEMLAKDVVTELNGTRHLTLVHALQRPVPPTWLAGDARVTPVVVTVWPEESTGHGPKWSEIAASRYHDDPAKYSAWQSDAGGATCFFVGLIQVDPPSTGAVRCEATWQEEGPEYLRRSTDKNNNLQYRYEPAANTARLFALSSIDSAVAASQINLLGEVVNGTPVNLRGLAYSFPDGRARKLSLRLVATSRFLSYFDTKKPADFESESDAVEVWLPCTYRPSPPTIDRIAPVFDYDVRADHHGNFSFTRTSRLRIELGPDPRMSGAGERMAVMFRKNNSDQLCDLFTPELEPYADGFTRWGRDALHETPVVGVIDPARFLRAGNGFSPANQNLVLKSGQEDTQDAGVGVDVVAYEPQLDPAAGFYCDLIVDPRNAAERAADLLSANAYMPFVHLGLARYQEHSVEGLQLSHAVGRDVQLLPWRHGSIQFITRNRFVLRLEGPIYGQREVLERKTNAPGPLLDITLLHDETYDTPQICWKPVPGDPETTHGYQVPPTVSADGKRWLWVWEGAFKEPWTRRRYGIRIEEFERIYDQEAQTPQVRGPVFSMTIDLWLHRTSLPVELVEP